MTDWIIWAVLLVLQNAAQTVTSRARNTKGQAGLWYNGIASMFSNGVWFTSQLFIVNMLINVKGKPAAFAAMLAFYIAFTASGSVVAHWISMKFERKRGFEHG